MTTTTQPITTHTDHADRNHRAARRTRIAALGAGILTLALLTGCQAGTNPADAQPSPTSEQPSESPSDDATNAPDYNNNDDAPAYDPATAPVPDGLPADLPSIGIPFYMPSEIVATASVGGPWVLEFVTDDDLDTVNNAIAHMFSETYGWSDIRPETVPERTVTHGAKDGYTLVIAVGADRDDATRTSLFYTLDQE